MGINKRLFEKYKLTIVPLTVLSIMDGLNFSDADYNNDKDEKEYLNIINSGAVIKRLLKEDTTKNNVYALMKDNSEKAFISLAEIIKNKYIQDEVLYKLKNCVKSFEGNKNISTIIKQYINNSYVSFLPGSSIKGAISTCVYDYVNSKINGLVDKKFIKVYTSNNYYKNKYSNNNDAQNALSRSLKISDAYPLNLKNIPIYLYREKIINPIKNINTNLNNNKKNFENMIEALPGSLIIENCPIFEADIISEKIVSEENYFSVSKFVKCCNQFSKKIFQEENNAPDYPMAKIRKQFISVDETLKEIEKIINDVQNKTDEFVIKIGRHSQMEYMTLSDNRQSVIKIKGKTIIKKFGSTRTLAFDEKYDKYYPFGWCKCKIEKI